LFSEATKTAAAPAQNASAAPKSAAPKPAAPKQSSKVVDPQSAGTTVTSKNPFSALTDVTDY